MGPDEFARRTEDLRGKLYKTAYLYMENQQDAMDVLDEAVFKALCALKQLKQPEYFDTWVTRILINECYTELRRRARFHPQEAFPDCAVEPYDYLPLREAIHRLPSELKDIIILRYFSGFTLAESARMLDIPQGTAATRQRKALKLLRLELDEEVEP